MASDGILGSWARSLRAANRSPATIDSYLSDCRSLETWLAAQGTDLLDANRDHIRSYLEHLLDAGKAPATAARRYRSFVQFYKWAHGEEEIASNPMTKVSPPKVPVDPPDVIRDADMAKLLDACRRNAAPRPPRGIETETEAGARRRKFEAVRDLAMILLLASTGIRAGELMGIRVGDINLDHETVAVSGKTGRRNVVLLPKVVTEVEKYLRARRRHAQASGTDALWIGDRGALTDSGLRQMLERRCDDAGIGHINPHRFRHTFAHLAKLRGVSDDALMAVAGWKSPQMLVRYGASAAEERGNDAIRKAFGGDF